MACTGAARGDSNEGLILGSGGREHALAWAVKKSGRVTEVVCAPGNGGMERIARCIPADLNHLDSMIAAVSAEQPDLTIIGPELPLSLGIVDALRALGYRVFGPTREAAMLETSKGFAKRFLQRHNIPTANYAVCASPAELEKAVDIFHPPIVVKADGLAAGKGVIICQSHRTAVEAAGSLFTGSLLGSAERQIVHRRVPRRRRNQLPLPHRRQAPLRRLCPPRITSVSAKETPAPIPAEWAFTRPTPCSIPE